ncbi:MAG TPA: hypothetical protein VHM01_01715 [Alphaproteobacteria bacterium]|nr:hypothetical protein [Alphaproteobacteria bacterium]
MLALAVANRRLTARLPAAGSRAAVRLRRNVWLEIGCATAIVAVTAWLGHTRPPSDTPEVHTHAAGRAFVAVDSDGASVLVEVLPGKPGPNRLVGRLIAEDGRPLAAQEFAIELSLTEAGIEALSAVGVREAEGTFTVSEIVLPLAGRWRMRIDALVSDFEKRVFTLQLDIE